MQSPTSQQDTSAWTKPGCVSSLEDFYSAERKVSKSAKVLIEQGIIDLEDLACLDISIAEPLSVLFKPTNNGKIEELGLSEADIQTNLVKLNSYCLDTYRMCGSKKTEDSAKSMKDQLDELIDKYPKHASDLHIAEWGTLRHSIMNIHSASIIHTCLHTSTNKLFTSFQKRLELTTSILDKTPQILSQEHLERIIEQNKTAKLVERLKESAKPIGGFLKHRLRTVCQLYHHHLPQNHHNKLISNETQELENSWSSLGDWNPKAISLYQQLKNEVNDKDKVDEVLSEECRFVHTRLATDIVKLRQSAGEVLNYHHTLTLNLEDSSKQLKQAQKHWKALQKYVCAEVDASRTSGGYMTDPLWYFQNLLKEYTKPSHDHHNPYCGCGTEHRILLEIYCQTKEVLFKDHLFDACQRLNKLTKSLQGYSKSSVPCQLLETFLDQHRSEIHLFEEIADCGTVKAGYDDTLKSTRASFLTDLQANQEFATVRTLDEFEEVLQDWLRAQQESKKEEVRTEVLDENWWEDPPVAKESKRSKQRKSKKRKPKLLPGAALLEGDNPSGQGTFVSKPSVMKKEQLNLTKRSMTNTTGAIGLRLGVSLPSPISLLTAPGAAGTSMPKVV